MWICNFLFDITTWPRLNLQNLYPPTKRKVSQPLLMLFMSVNGTTILVVQVIHMGSLDTFISLVHQIHHQGLLILSPMSPLTNPSPSHISQPVLTSIKIFPASRLSQVALLEIPTGLAQSLRHLPSKCKALSSNPSTAKKKKKSYQCNPSEVIHLFVWSCDYLLSSPLNFEPHKSGNTFSYSLLWPVLSLAHMRYHILTTMQGLEGTLLAFHCRRTRTWTRNSGDLSHQAPGHQQCVLR
jgi:hypothetical protein